MQDANLSVLLEYLKMLPSSYAGIMSNASRYLIYQNYAGVISLA